MRGAATSFSQVCVPVRTLTAVDTNLCRGVGTLFLSVLLLYPPLVIIFTIVIWFCILISTVVHTSMFLHRSLSTSSIPVIVFTRAFAVSL